MNTKNMISDLMRDAAEIIYDQSANKLLINASNQDLLKITELLILANHNKAIEEKLDNITIYLAELSRK